MNHKMEKTVFVIEGHARSANGERDRLWIDGVELHPKASQAIRNHSPDGFSWGYGGSGPAQTALAICLHLFASQRVAERLYQRFKEVFVSQWTPAGEDFQTTIDIADFLIGNRDLLE